ncbi:MAG TPA: PLDc N-terminal domain-containing protein [Gammaproteobacteria bacterium]|nr:PLDc N-terminal domain-containing protein [Gammaproteobacteria bacterium]
MRVLTALIVLVVLVLILGPVVGFVMAVAIPLGGFVIWLLPILIIACSDRTTGAEKLAWILAIVFLSWFAWIFYFLLAPIKKPDPWRHAASRSYRRDFYRYD